MKLHLLISAILDSGVPDQGLNHHSTRKDDEMTQSIFKVKRLKGFVLLCCALLTALAGSLCAQTQAKPLPKQGTSTLTVRVTGLRNANGKVLLSLTSDSKPIDSRAVEIDGKTSSAQAVFENLPHGIYSVNVFHDENMNGKMDFNEMGTPTEGYGASNNPERRMGPPDPDAVKFTVDQPSTAIEIKLIYWE